jgi:hypothetical protein
MRSSSLKHWSFLVWLLLIFGTRPTNLTREQVDRPHRGAGQKGKHERYLLGHGRIHTIQII